MFKKGLVHEYVCRSGDKDSRVLNLGTRWMLVANLAP
jgi:hypothetical protein